jgi:PAS domain S-box-containing protein
VVLDLSAIRRSEQAVRAAGWMVRLLTDSLKDAVMCYDMGRRLQYVNPAIETLTGYTVGELKREQFICWVHPEDRERMLAYWDRLFAGASYEDVEYKLVTKQGEVKWVEASWGPILDDQGRQVGVKGSERDISARKRADQERAELCARLHQAQKLESVGRLAGGVAHDFNNLLTVIDGYTSLALDQLGPEDPLRAPLEEVLRASSRAGGLVRQLLAFGRGQILQPGPLDLGEVLRGMEGALRRLAGDAVQIRADLPRGLRPLFADRRQVEQVLMNLTTNARDAMPRGGTLTVSAADLDGASRCPHCGAGLIEGDYVSIDITDTGVGMDENVRRRLFEPFFSTKPAGKGTGLGLATVYGVVTQSGGHICVESAMGRGTAFHLCMPAAVREP